MKKCLLIPVIFSAACLAQALEFTTPPSFVKDAGSTWRITFAVSESTDVEVSIVNIATKAVVRHLAAGVLGSNTPPPLASHSLSQVLFWDGLDDYRAPAASPENLTVRVRAGMAVCMRQAAGGDPYAYYVPGQERVASYGIWLNGMEQLDNGNVVVMGRPFLFQSTVLREFTPKGEYVRTLFPFSGNRAADAGTALGFNQLETGEWVPQSGGFFEVNQTFTPLRQMNMMVPVHGPGRLAFLCPWMEGKPGVINRHTLWVMNSDGTRDAACITATQPLIAGPCALPIGKWEGGIMGGPYATAMTPDRSAFYLTGLFRWEGSGVSDTSFWQGGCIYKVDMATRTPVRFFSLDTLVRENANRNSLLGGSNFSELQGLIVDDSGRIFVCDRLHQRVIVLDTAGQILRTLPVVNPDNITLNRATGAVYVSTLNRSLLGLVKFGNWRTDTAATARVTPVTLPNDFYITCGYNNGSMRKSFVQACQTNEGPLVWQAFTQHGVQIFRDEGATFSAYKDFTQACTQKFIGIYRLAVDPRDETAYLNSGWYHMYKVADWSRPVFSQCTTSTGAPLYGWDMALDSRNHFMYVRGPMTASDYGNIGATGHLYRYTLDARPAPAPLAGRTGSQFTDSVVSVRGVWAAYGDHGIAVAPNGDLGLISCKTVGVLEPYSVRYFSARGNPASVRVTPVIDALPLMNSGLHFDLQGNLYIGKQPASSATGLPSSLTTDPGYAASIGSVWKYAPDGSLDSTLFNALSAGPSLQYAADYGPMGDPGCTCINARFGMDAFGRLYVPNAIFQKISILDNAGNRIRRIGTYGNLDDLNNELSGAPGSLGNCTMAYPFCVEATDDYIYATDMANYTLLRMQKTFILDNVPSMSTASANPAPVKGPLAFSAFPNPFMPQCRIQVALPRAARLTLDVLDVSGRLVARLAQGTFSSGAKSFVWNGKRSDGSRAAAGLYFYRLVTDRESRTIRTILAR